MNNLHKFRRMKRNLVITLLFVFVSLAQAQQIADDKQLLSVLLNAQKQVDAQKFNEAKVLLEEANSYFKAKYKYTDVVSLLNTYYNQKLFYAMGEKTDMTNSFYSSIKRYAPKITDNIDAKKNLITAYNDLLRETKVKLAYPAYNLMEAKLFLQKAKQKAPVQTTWFEEELLNLCGFDFNVETIEKSLQIIDKRLSEFTNDELCEVGNTPEMTVHFHLFELAAKNGSVNGNILAGYYAENGMGCPQNLEKARHYYQVATDAGDEQGACLLANLYFYGKGVEQDKMKVAQILVPFENKDEFHKWGGSYLMAHLYETGTGVVKNTDKAMIFFMEAAEKLYFPQNKDNAYMQYKRLMQEKESEKLSKSIENKDITKLSGSELRNIALDYEYFGNAESAEKYLQLAAEKKDGFSCNYLGVFYSSDKKNEARLEQAVVYFKLGVELDYGPAIYNYARALYFGEGVFPDIDAANMYANRYFKIVDDGKHNNFREKELVAFYTGTRYSEESLIRGTLLKTTYTDMMDKGLLMWGMKNREKNTASALYYYERSRLKGNKEATAWIGIIYLEGTETIKPDYEKAYKYLTEAIPNLYAYYNLGEMHENGKGVEVNLEKAIEYYRLAEKSGFDKGLIAKKLNSLR